MWLNMIEILHSNFINCSFINDIGSYVHSVRPEIRPIRQLFQIWLRLIFEMIEMQKFSFSGDGKHFYPNFQINFTSELF